MSELDQQSAPTNAPSQRSPTERQQDDNNPRSGTLPKLLGYSGLLPMAGVLGGQFFLPLYADHLLYLAMLYVGVIFAFLGGIQWGLVLQWTAADVIDANKRLLASVLPALTTIIALVIPQAPGCLLLGIGLWMLLAFEWTNRRNMHPPTWYRPLRINLTILLSGSLAAALWLA